MKRQDRIAGRPRQPDGARLRHSGRTARAIYREPGRPPPRHLAPELQQRFPGATRSRSARRAKTEALDDTGDPFAVEILARDDDDPAVPEVISRGKDTGVPERHDRLPAAARDG